MKRILGYIVGAVGATLSLLLMLFKHQRDSAREEAEKERRERQTSDERLEQRTKSQEADQAGEKKTAAMRQEAKQKAKKGKRDAFEDSSWD